MSHESSPDPDDRAALHVRATEIVDAALITLWAQVAAAFPEVRTGDCPPDLDHKLNTMLVDAVTFCVLANSGNETDTADVIRAVRIDVRMGRATAFVTYADGVPEKLCSWFVDELSLSEADFIGKTPEQARHLHHTRDVAFLQQG